MLKTISAVLLILYGFIAAMLLMFTQPTHEQWFYQFSYCQMFIVIPFVGSYCVLKGNRLGLVPLLVLFATQVVRPLPLNELFPFQAPFSLAMPFGNFSQGQGYLVDFFAIAMLLVVASIIVKQKVK
ncbi:hypothetical protein [Shewanella sp. TC10]|uniref:hypothetical protein n=1 Tax=Shewanella sp. TC10 TaxID=1419739 RepID=UPI00129D2F81|nr:hypothetical protein [Shewanella sp. TC10]